MIAGVPLLMLSGYGGIQIHDQVQRSARAAALAENISVLPTIIRYSTDVAAALGVREFNLSANENAAMLDDSTASVEALTQRTDLDPVLSNGITRILTEGRALSPAPATPNITLASRIEQVRSFGETVQHTARSLVGRTENAAALDEADRMLELLRARLMSFDQAAAFTTSAGDSVVAQQLLETSIASERAQLSTLRARDEDQQALDEFLAATNARHHLLLEPATSATRTADLTAALLAGVDAGDRLLDNSMDRIVTVLDDQRNAARASAIRTGTLIIASVVLAVAITLTLIGLLVNALRRLRDDTTRVAYDDLPSAVAAIRADTDPATVAIDSIGPDTDEEIGQIARAVDGVNAQALLLAAEQAALRRQITAMLETLARRSRSLVDRQLVLIEALEYSERDPKRLQNLFELDHLASRMRRTGESLLVLAGTRSRRVSRSATPLEDVIRASVSQVENYERVALQAIPPVMLVGSVVDDLIHLLTELLDNSLRASDPRTSVVCAVSPAVENGLLLEIVDRGIGIPTDDLVRINDRLATGAEADAQATRNMGLYVVGRVAQRHGFRVRLRPTAELDRARGITAGVYLPHTVIHGQGIEISWSTVEHPRRLADPDSVGSGSVRLH